MADFPLYLAPMAGYTDLPFRMLCRALGADVVTTEMVSAKGLVYGAKATRALLSSCPEEQPLTVQLFGREPAILADATKICEDELGCGLSAIDLNMGCPMPKITRNGEGSALMKEPALAGTIVAAVAKTASVPVTVKCRSGWDEQHENAAEFAKVCEDNGAAMITIHARPRDRFYSGKADWDVIARVKYVLSIPLIGNGDVHGGADAIRLREQTDCDGVAVGRAALGNPWVFQEIRALCEGQPFTPPSEAQRREAALRHARMALTLKGPRAIVELRKQIACYIHGIPGAAAMRVHVNAAKSYEDLVEILS